MIFFLCQKFSYDFFLMNFFLIQFFSYPVSDKKILMVMHEKTQVFLEKLDSIGVQMKIYSYDWSKK